MLRRSPRQAGAIELGNRTEVEREADTFTGRKAAVKRKRIHARLTDREIGAVCCMADRRTIRQRIAVKQQRCLAGTGLRRRGISRQQLHIRTRTSRAGCTSCSRCTARAGGACRAGGTAWASRACQTGCAARAGGACRTGYTARAGRSGRAGCTVRASRACWASCTARAGGSGRTGGYIVFCTTCPHSSLLLITILLHFDMGLRKSVQW